MSTGSGEHDGTRGESGVGATGDVTVVECEHSCNAGSRRGRDSAAGDRTGTGDQRERTCRTGGENCRRAVSADSRFLRTRDERAQGEVSEFFRSGGTRNRGSGKPG